ncbi:nuclear transport factor 2 family protein [Crocosphaera sp. XPORK-15E]|uniref:nuclear transport factor 2 family protein n=1 Tax=Crocosphaera sp. XPORK-15E TaxID=3110247 RepID=UPI002B202008|nr:nuclear transport factor 2 family protein [Crocosphaera sp. XPORK-15E]MEA5536810.1 nuclear transport factor 2 family protein [Crocosphaera sp. XPORK-15E]
MTTDDKSEVIAINEAFYRAFEKRELSALSQIWWQGAGSTCIHPGGNVLKGWEPIRTSWETIFKNTDYLEIDTEIINIDMGQEIAYIVLIEKVTQVHKGKKLEALSMATNGFRRMAQKWYLVHHHGSPIMRK